MSPFRVCAFILKIVTGAELKSTLDAHEAAATRLGERAEDGGVAGHKTSQTSQDQIAATQ